MWRNNRLRCVAAYQLELQYGNHERIMSASAEPLVFMPREPGISSGGFPYGLHVLSHDDDATAIFELRHAAYRQDGFIMEAAASGQYRDDADSFGQTIHFAAYDGDECKCAARMTLKGWGDAVNVLPCAPYYPAIQSAGLRKLSIAELSHIIIDPAVTNAVHRTVLYSAMVRAGLIAVQASRVAMLVAAARPESLELYTRLLRFHTIGIPAHYPPARTDMTLLGGNMIGAGRREVERNAFFKPSQTELESMRAALLRCLGSSPHTRVLAQSLDGPGA